MFFLVRADWRAVLTGTLAFLGGGVVGAVRAPRDSVQYWTTTVFDATRIGDPAGATDQNLRAVIARIGLAGDIAALIWATVAVVVLAVAVIAARRAAGAGQLPLALVAVGIAGLLISPVSWSHHWMWCVPALLVLASIGRAHPPARWLAISGAIVFVAAPHGVLPHDHGTEHAWSWWEQTIGASYVLWALTMLGTVAARGHQWRAAMRSNPGGGGPGFPRQAGPRPAPAQSRDEAV
jgi:alpha-1,2-mannosyltransferase